MAYTNPSTERTLRHVSRCDELDLLESLKEVKLKGKSRLSLNKDCHAIIGDEGIRIASEKAGEER